MQSLLNDLTCSNSPSSLLMEILFSKPDVIYVTSNSNSALIHWNDDDEILLGNDQISINQ